MTENDFGLGEWIKQLKQVTGHEDVKKVAPPTVSMDETEKLRLRQSLKWHPIFLEDATTLEDKLRLLVTMLVEVEDAVVPETVGDSSLAWINVVAEELEKERTRFVRRRGGSDAAAVESRLLARLGVDQLPDVRQVSDARFSPWYVLWSLMTSEVCGLCEADAVVDIEIASPTAAVVKEAAAIRKHCYNTIAWQDLLTAVEEFPLEAVRPIWGAALAVFPSSPRLVEAYAEKEVAAIQSRSALWTTGDETEVRTLFKDCLRLLNLFYRHLPYCYSVNLYTKFFSFLDVIGPEVKVLDFLYRSSLSVVGQLPHSAPLWMAYIKWRPTVMPGKGQQPLLWKRRKLQALLHIPLLGLEQIKAEYDELAEIPHLGVIDSDEKYRIESRYRRAEGESKEMRSYIERLYTFPIGLERRTPSQLFYLPRPLRKHHHLQPTNDASEAEAGALLDYFNPDSIQDDIVSDVELMCWELWQRLLDLAARSTSSEAFSPARKQERMYSFCRAAACYFPHLPDLWYRTLACAKSATEKTEEKIALCIELITRFVPFNPLTSMLIAETYFTTLKRPEMVSVTLKSTLLHIRASLEQTIKAAAAARPPGTPAAETTEGPSSDIHSTALTCCEALKQICTLGINWMRFSSPESLAQRHCALVARFVLHDTLFLTLTMNVLRMLLSRDGSTDPNPILRPFSVFCANWVHLEVVRNGDSATACLILQQWTAHILPMLSASAKRQWPAEYCGADDLFVTCCSEVIHADFSTRQRVLGILGVVVEHIEEHNIRSDTFIPSANLLLHAQYLAVPFPKRGSLLSARNVPLLPYDVPLFGTETPTRAMWRCLLENAGAACSPDSVAPPDLGATEAAAAAEVAAPPAAQPDAPAAEQSENPDTADTKLPGEDAREIAEAAANSSGGPSATSDDESTAPPAAARLPGVTYPDEDQWAPYERAPRQPHGSGPFHHGDSRQQDFAPEGYRRESFINRSHLRRNHGHVACGSQLPSLAACLARVTNGDGRRLIRNNDTPNVDALDRLLRNLPTYVEFLAGGEDGEEVKELLSVDWILHQLANMTSIQYDEVDADPTGDGSGYSDGIADEEGEEPAETDALDGGEEEEGEWYGEDDGQYEWDAEDVVDDMAAPLDDEEEEEEEQIGAEFEGDEGDGVESEEDDVV